MLQQSDGLSDYEDDEFDEESVFSTITSTTRNTFSKKIRDGIDSKCFIGGGGDDQSVIRHDLINESFNNINWS